MRKVNYNKILKDSGEIIELVSFYEVPENLLINPPLLDKEISEIIEIMKKSGIKDIRIII